MSEKREYTAKLSIGSRFVCVGVEAASDEEAVVAADELARGWADVDWIEESGRTVVEGGRVEAEDDRVVFESGRRHYAREPFIACWL